MDEFTHYSFQERVDWIYWEHGPKAWLEWWDWMVTKTVDLREVPVGFFD